MAARLGADPGRVGEGLTTDDNRVPDRHTWDGAVSRLQAVRAVLNDLAARTDATTTVATTLCRARDELDGCLRAAELIAAADATTSVAGVAVLDRIVATTTAGRRVVASVVEVPWSVTKESQAVRANVTLPG